MPVVRVAHPFVGRQVELRRLDEWLGELVAGRSRPLLLEGAPGIGKTSLLRAVRERAGTLGARSLAITPIPNASSLALAGLGAFVGHLRADLELADQEAVAPLLLALADPAANANPVALSGGLIALLAAAAEQQPLALIIDDGQWLDRSSAEVIIAAFRGLALDQVGLLVAVRADEPHPFEELPRLPVEGLDRESTHDLFASLHVDDAVLDRCWEATAGNPLALEVILRGLEPEERSGTRPLPNPLPVADSIAHAFRRRFEALPPATFRALVVLAADSGASPSSLDAAIAQLGGTSVDLDAAEEARLIVRTSGQPAFSHPLLRATALAVAKPAERRAAHRALADAHERAGEREARAWQLAAAANGPDDEAAAALLEVADAARRRGATAAAAEGYLMAARLSGSAPERAARLLAAGDATWVVGRVEEATAILGEAIESSSTVTDRAQGSALLGQIELWAQGPRVARDRFLDASVSVEGDDAGFAARLLGHAAFTAVASGDVRGALPLAQRSMTTAPEDDIAASIQSTVTLGYLECHAGLADGAPRLQPIIAIAEQLVDSDDPDVVGLLGLLGMCLTEGERFVEAERFLGAVVRRSRREGATATGALVAAILAENHWRTGNWLEAAHLASNDVVAGATLPVNQAWATAFLAHLDGAAGRAELCRKRSLEASRAATSTGADVVAIWAGHAMGLLELGSGRWAEAARHLDKVAALTESLGRQLPGAVWWQGDHIEALARAGRPDDAWRALERLEREGSVGEQRWPACVAARGRALLVGDDDRDEALRHLASSLELAEAIPAPFEVARTCVARAERHLADGDRDAAADDLRRAVDGFDRLGAAAFAERARALLGEPVAARSVVSLADLLTPAELRVALAVAKGSTNREVAAELFVSAKTVEYHLLNVYRKLNLRSRTELAVRVSQATPG